MNRAGTEMRVLLEKCGLCLKNADFGMGPHFGACSIVNENVGVPSLDQFLDESRQVYAFD